MPRQPQPDEQRIDLPFPSRGLDLSPAYAQQQKLTTPLGKNVRAYEPSTDRARGGSRPGLARFVNALVSGVHHIQEIQYIIGTGLASIPGSGGTYSVLAYSDAGEAPGSARVALSGGGADLWTHPADFVGGTTQAAAVAAPADALGAAVLWVDGPAAQWRVARAGKLTARGDLPTGSVPASFSVTSDGTDFYLLGSGTTSTYALRVTPAGVVTWSTTPGSGSVTPDTTETTGSVVVLGVLYGSVPLVGLVRVNGSTGAAGAPFVIAAAADVSAAAPGYELTPGRLDANATVLAAPVENATGLIGAVFVNRITGAFSPTPYLGIAAEPTDGGARPQVSSDGTDFYLLIPEKNAAAPYSEVWKFSGTAGTKSWASAAFGGSPAETLSKKAGPTGTTTACCPSDPVPATLTATLSNGLNCACLAGAAVTLTYDGVSAWAGSTTLAGCTGGTLGLSLTCAAGTWKMTFTGCTPVPNVPASSAVCSPLALTWTGINSATCCTGVGTFGVTVTP